MDGPALKTAAGLVERLERATALGNAALLSVAALGLALFLLLGLAAATGPRRRKGSSGLPSPPGLPLLGHALTLHAPGTRLLATLRAWGEAYGGAFELHVGRLPLLVGRLCGTTGPGGYPATVVVLSRPDAVHALLALDERAAGKARRYYGTLEQLLHPSRSPCLLTAPDAATWQPVRRSLLYAFSKGELQLDVEVMKAKAALLVASLLRRGPGAVVDMADASLRLSLDAVGLCKLGYDFEAVQSPGEVLLLRLLRGVAEEADARRRRLLGGGAAAWAEDAAAEAQQRCRVLAAFVETELWADVEARGEPPVDDISLAAQLVRLSAESESSASAGLPLRRVLAEVAGALLAGHEPLGLALAWSLHCLAGHKMAQDKLVAELKREGVYDKPQDLSYDTLQGRRLPYLDAVVREALRLFPTLPCPATARSVKQDLELCGGGAGGPAVRVTAGSEVWVDVHAMHRSPALWASPDAFNPERWAAAAAAATTADAAASGAAEGKQDGQEDGGASASAAASPEAAASPYDGLSTVEPEPGSEEPPPPPVAVTAAAAAAAAATEAAAPASAPPLCSPDAFMPFGAGPRSCLGQRFAVASLKTALVVMLCHVGFEPSGAAPAAELSLFLRPAGGQLPLQVHPRKRGGGA